jgi:hypothetical protein
LRPCLAQSPRPSLTTASSERGCLADPSRPDHVVAVGKSDSQM